MSLSIAAAVFPVIFVGELPDKTMLASLVLAARGRPQAVWAGAALAFFIHVVIATTAGVLLFRLLPERVAGLAVAAVFAAGAALAAREAWAARRDRGEESGLAPSGFGSPEPSHEPRGRSPRRTMATAFVVIFAAEWGDLTQILTASLAARYHQPLAVGAGALLALWAVAGLAVIGGQRLGAALRPAALRILLAALLAGLAIYTTWAALS